MIDACLLTPNPQLFTVSCVSFSALLEQLCSRLEGWLMHVTSTDFLEFSFRVQRMWSRCQAGFYSGSLVLWFSSLPDPLNGTLPWLREVGGRLGFINGCTSLGIALSNIPGLGFELSLSAHLECSVRVVGWVNVRVMMWPIVVGRVLSSVQDLTMHLHNTMTILARCLQAGNKLAHVGLAFACLQSSTSLRWLQVTISILVEPATQEEIHGTDTPISIKIVAQIRHTGDVARLPQVSQRLDWRSTIEPLVVPDFCIFQVPLVLEGTVGMLRPADVIVWHVMMQCCCCHLILCG
mmetsp:Transcript_78586/g.163290  ORF Transcript_78586/g.163290 Transcript_78586/m.163290 type:complete len:293 (+) Transcript_78586:1080-1958(+)